MKDNPLVSLIIITRNREKELKQLIKSIFNSTYKNFEIIIFDNGSEKKLKLIESEKITYIYSEKNLMGIGRNRGSEKAKGDFLFFLDDDAKIHKDCIKKLVENYYKLKNPGILTPSMYSFEGRLMYTGRAISMLTSKNQLYPKQNTKNYELSGNPNKYPWFTGTYGAFAFIKKSLFKEIGKFDEDFVLHYEETELSLKVLEKGKKIYYIGNAITYHPDNKETNGNNLKSKIDRFLWQNILFYPERCYFTSRNRILLMKKHASLTRYILFILTFNNLFILYHTLLMMVSLTYDFKKSIVRLKNYYKGVFSGIFK